MRILFVAHLPPQPGGGNISRGALVAAFARAGADLVCIAPITAEALTGGDRFAADQPELRVVRYLVPSFQVADLGLAPPEHQAIEREALERLIARCVASFRPDLLVAGRESLAGVVADLASGQGLPTVLLARGNPTCYILGGQYDPREAAVLATEFRRFDRIICVADFMTAGLRSLGCRNVVTIPNVVGVPGFSPRAPSRTLRAEWSIPTDHAVVLAPGHLIRRKRPADVVHSAFRVVARRPKVTYAFVGAGYLREPLERMVRDRGLAGHFRFTGWVDHALMPDVVNLADVVVMATEAEGMARSYLEAMACGRTLIASDIPPAREVVQDGENGLLFPVGDVERLAARTLEALDDPDLRARLGANARGSVGWRTLEHVTPLYLEQFRHAIGRAARG